MSTYVIGDVHGCYVELKKLLTIIKFDPQSDKALFVGDLVGRGPNSLQVLDLIMSLGNSAVRVFGNHDLKLIAMAYNVFRINELDNTHLILQSAHVDKYISWLLKSKLLFFDEKSHSIITHAGIPPAWDYHIAVEQAQFFEKYMLSEGVKKTLEIVYSGSSLNLHYNMNLEERLQYTVFGFTRMKYCYDDGSFDAECQCAPGQQPDYLNPWFLVNNKRTFAPYNLFFGHWASLGLYEQPNITCCDTGCVWGEKLTAIKVEPKRQLYHVKSSYNASLNVN